MLELEFFLLKVRLPGLLDVQVTASCQPSFEIIPLDVVEYSQIFFSLLAMRMVAIKTVAKVKMNLAITSYLSFDSFLKVPIMRVLNLVANSVYLKR